MQLEIAFAGDLYVAHSDKYASFWKLIYQDITDTDLRDKVQRQLNKEEHRHQLARCIFFANQGKFQIGDYEEIMNKASCLSLVSNAVLFWNTIKMTGIIIQLRKNGEAISNETLSHISLLIHKHLITMGTYFTDKAVEQLITLRMCDILRF